MLDKYKAMLDKFGVPDQLRKPNNDIKISPLNKGIPVRDLTLIAMNEEGPAYDGVNGWITFLFWDSMEAYDRTICYVKVERCKPTLVVFSSGWTNYNVEVNSGVVHKLEEIAQKAPAKIHKFMERIKISIEYIETFFGEYPKNGTYFAGYTGNAILCDLMACLCSSGSFTIENPGSLNVLKKFLENQGILGDEQSKLINEVQQSSDVLLHDVNIINSFGPQLGNVYNLKQPVPYEYTSLEILIPSSYQKNLCYLEYSKNQHPPYDLSYILEHDEVVKSSILSPRNTKEGYTAYLDPVTRSFYWNGYFEYVWNNSPIERERYKNYSDFLLACFDKLWLSYELSKENQNKQNAFCNDYNEIENLNSTGVVTKIGRRSRNAQNLFPKPMISTLEKEITPLRCAKLNDDTEINFLTYLWLCLAVQDPNISVSEMGWVSIGDGSIMGDENTCTFQAFAKIDPITRQVLNTVFAFGPPMNYPGFPPKTLNEFLHELKIFKNGDFILDYEFFMPMLEAIMELKNKYNGFSMEKISFTGYGIGGVVSDLLAALCKRESNTFENPGSYDAVKNFLIRQGFNSEELKGLMEWLHQNCRTLLNDVNVWNCINPQLGSLFQVAKPIYEYNYNLGIEISSNYKQNKLYMKYSLEQHNINHLIFCLSNNGVTPLASYPINSKDAYTEFLNPVSRKGYWDGYFDHLWITDSKWREKYSYDEFIKLCYEKLWAAYNASKENEITLNHNGFFFISPSISNNTIQNSTTEKNNDSNDSITVSNDINEFVIINKDDCDNDETQNDKIEPSSRCNIM